MYDSPIPEWNLTASEGELALDVFRTEDALIVRSMIAGARVEDLDLAIDGDLLTLRGKRDLREDINEDDWFLRECYWGSFSRSLILPLDVLTEKAQASFTDGVLTIRFPLRMSGLHLPIRILDQ